MKKNVLFIMNTAILLCLNGAYADENTDNESSIDEEPVHLESMVIDAEAVTVSPQHKLNADDIAKKQSQVSDTAKLLEGTSGMSFQSGGGVSSLPIIRGLNDTRVKVEVNGMTVNSICPNHMNPALASIDRSNIGSITVLKGITPVRMGGDSIAGTISVESAKPKFAEADEKYLLNGTISSFYRSNGDAVGGNAAIGIANEYVRFDYSGAHTQSSNYKDGSGQIIESTGYINQNHAFSLAFTADDHLLELQGGQQHIPHQGFPTARMDLTNNDSIFGNLHYDGGFDWGRVDGRLFLENTSHTMDYLPGRKAIEPMPMETDGKNYGYRLLFEIPLDEQDTVFRVGSEFHGSEIHDYWPATNTNPNLFSMMGPNNFINLNHATRDRFGIFVEWEQMWGDNWQTMLGFRYDRTMADTGDAQAYNNKPETEYIPDYIQALDFNSSDHERNYDAFDMSLLVQYMPNDWSKYTLGYARKNRAPSLQELYPWSIRPMPMTMIGWFADGNGYTGNIDLKMETAHNISLTANISDPSDKAAWNIEVSPFFSYVENYIDADLCKYCDKQPTDGFYYLQMANHDAYLWGIDITADMHLFTHDKYGEFSTNTVMSYVRGKRTDGDNLYHMMPFNLKWGIQHELGGFQSSIDMQFVDTKDDVQDVRNELTTASYVLLNFKMRYEWEFIGLDFGVDNILDKQYFSPLSGVYIGDSNVMTLEGQSKQQNLAAQGRSVYVGVTLTY